MRIPLYATWEKYGAAGLRPIRILTVLLLFTLGCQAGNDQVLPQEMDPIWGMWKTSEPYYSDRFLDLTKGTMILGTGERGVVLHPIRKIEKTYENNQALYTITYLNKHDQEYRLSFYYIPDDGGMIRFKNQKQIEWTREEH